jgi:TolB-like protein
MLGDDSKQPRYIVTVPKRGYRMVATVLAEPVTPNISRVRRWRVGILLGVAALAAAALGLTYSNVRSRSVAVLPFLDLTSQSMSEEYFADGMTEEIIGRLSKMPGLRVPSPTASFYFKGKQTSVDAIAKALHVDYVLDGSVRRSGATLRVSTRLVRANDGFVIWSEAYDRPSGDLLPIQDDIAGKVAKALEAPLALKSK